MRCSKRARTRSSRMASSRRSRQADPAGTPLERSRRRTKSGTCATGAEPVLDAVRDALRDSLAEREAGAAEGGAAAPTRIVVALSGGRDSIALLDALAQVARQHRVTLSAMHVHHGL